MQSILVAFDGSEQSRAAMEYAFQVFPDADFTVLYPLEPERSASQLLDVKSVREWLQSSKQRGQELRDVVKETSERYGVSATSKVVVSGMNKSVVESCETGDYDQVFIGNFSQSDRRIRLFSEKTERTVRRISIPVTAVRTPNQSKPDTVLVPVDGSKQANRALDYACQMFPDANITGLNITDPLILHLNDLDTTDWESETVEQWEAEIEAHDTEVESVVQSLREESSTILRRATSRAADHGVELSTASVDGWPAEEILKYVENHDSDHVCMGSHGRTGLQRYLLGSVTESVLRECLIPVTTLRGSRKKE